MSDDHKRLLELRSQLSTLREAQIEIEEEADQQLKKQRQIMRHVDARMALENVSRQELEDALVKASKFSGLGLQGHAAPVAINSGLSEAVTERANSLVAEIKTGVAKEEAELLDGRMFGRSTDGWISTPVAARLRRQLTSDEGPPRKFTQVEGEPAVEAADRFLSLEIPRALTGGKAVAPRMSSAALARAAQRNHQPAVGYFEGGISAISPAGKKALGIVRSLEDDPFILQLSNQLSDREMAWFADMIEQLAQVVTWYREDLESDHVSSFYAAILRSAFEQGDDKILIDNLYQTVINGNRVLIRRDFADPKLRDAPDEVLDDHIKRSGLSKNLLQTAVKFLLRSSIPDRVFDNVNRFELAVRDRPLPARFGEPGVWLMALGLLARSAGFARAIDLLDCDPDMIVVGDKPSWYLNQFRSDEGMLSLARFAMLWAPGFPVVRLGHKLAAALALTEPPGAIELPWPAFVVSLPPGLFQVKDEDTGLTIDLRMVYVREGELMVSTSQEEGAKMWRIDLPGGLGAEADRSATAKDEHARLITMVERLMVGVCLALSDHEHVGRSPFRPDRPKKGEKRGRRPGVEPPEGTVYELRAPISIDLRETLADVLSGRAKKRGGGWTVNKQFLVVGHHRNQACGPKHSLRRKTWIAPHWKGPEEARALLRAYKLDSKGAPAQGGNDGQSEEEQAGG